MSYTNFDTIKKLNNSNVFFFDLETTGLPINCKRETKPEESYPDYKENQHYDCSRIVQIGWIYVQNFKFNEPVDPNNINSEIIKPKNFTIPELAIKIHNITNEYAKQNGKKIKKVFMDKFIQKIKECDYIAGYNVFFDVNILLNELYRCGLIETIEIITNLVSNKKVICIGQLARQYFKYTYGNKYFETPYSFPAQKTIYMKIFNKELKNQHNAKFDILATIEVMNSIALKKCDFQEIDFEINTIPQNVTMSANERLIYYIDQINMLISKNMNKCSIVEENILKFIEKI